MKIGDIIPFDTYGQHMAASLLYLQTGGGVNAVPLTIAANGDGSADLTTGAVGIFTPGTYDAHLLPKWEVKAHVKALSADGLFGAGIWDTPRYTGPVITGNEMTWWLFADRSTSTIGLKQFDEILNIRPYTVPVSSSFNWADFTMQGMYESGYFSFCVRDSNGLAVWGRYRMDMRGGYQCPPTGAFGFRQLAGTSTLAEIGFSSREEPGADYLFIGDSITVGRKNYPETVRYADAMARLFRDDGNPKRVSVWASGGMSISLMLPYLSTSVQAVAPKNVVILMGDNDNDYALGSISDLSSVIGKLGKFVSDLRAANIGVYIISMTPETYSTGENSATTGQRHDTQHAYIQSGDFNTDLTATYGCTCNVINVWDSMKLPNGSDPGYPDRETMNPDYVVDYVHPNAAGHNLIAGIVKSSITAVPAYDTDAQAFIDAVDTAGGTLSSTEKDAVNQRVLDMKANGVWAKYYCYYPLVGSSAAAHAINLKNPAQFLATFFGSPTHNANGIVWNGVNQYADTGLNPSSVMTPYNTAMGYYSRTNGNSASVDCGCGDPNFEISIAFNGTLHSYGYDINQHVTGANADAAGLWVQNVESSVLHRVFKNGTAFATDTTPNTSPLPNATVKFGASNGIGNTYYSQRDCASFFLSKSLTAAQLAAEYASEQAFQTTLGRQV